MKRFWWRLRLGVLCVLFVGLGVYLFQSTPWRKLLGQKADYAAVLAEGDRLVAAVTAFHADHGLWPQYIDDLVPNYLPALPAPPAAKAPAWFYDLAPATVDGHALPSLSIHADGEGPRAHIGYDFDPAAPAWRLFGDSVDEPRVLRAGRPPAASRPALAPDRVLANALAEMDRRIAREPGDIAHLRGKAALLRALGREGAVRELVQEAAASQPGSFWPRMALAVLDLEAASRGGAGSRPAAEGAAGSQPAPHSPWPPSAEAFAQWARGESDAPGGRSPTMTRWFYLSVLYRMAGRPDDAAAAMASAVTLPVEVRADDPNVAGYYLWDMARWAVDTKRWPLVLAICGVWEDAETDHTVLDASYLPLRAAARLATGDIGAGADLAKLADKKHVWAQNLDALRQAVERNDRTFTYHPGAVPGPFQIFVTPE